jgi:site-specific recombinase XerD
MAPIPWGKFLTVAEHQLARRWLQFTANIGRAPNTVDAYGRAVEDHLRGRAAEGTDPLLARADTVAAWIRNMLDRPSRKPSKVPPRTKTGLANATIQQRMVAVRSFYEYLVEDGPA